MPRSRRGHCRRRSTIPAFDPKWICQLNVLLTQQQGIRIERMTIQEVLTISGQILLLVGGVLAAALGAGGGLRYFVEPILKRRRLRKVMGTGLRLSCYELRRHLEKIRDDLKKSSDQTRNALKKIPRNDWKEQADWFVKDGYFSMITAYKIAAFSSWMKIYQMAVLRALLTTRWNKFISELFSKFDSYKISVSRETYFWPDYIDAIGEGIISTSGELTEPFGFSEFCNRYKMDADFMAFFEQLHMFIHFIGRTDEPWSTIYPRALDDVIQNLRSIEELLNRKQENLLRRFEPKEYDRTASAKPASLIT